MPYSLVRWEGEIPSVSDIEEKFRAEGLDAHSWSNSPGDRYDMHSHDYEKVLYCVTGSITFDVEGEQVEVLAGDRLEIPAGVEHSALVGGQGVTCMEAARS